MKPIRNYSDGQWLLLLWGLIVLFLLGGLFLGSTAVVVVAVLGGVGAGYTTYLYVQNAAGPRSSSPASDADSNEGGKP
jgi:hypothetical protein